MVGETHAVCRRFDDLSDVVFVPDVQGTGQSQGKGTPVPDGDDDDDVPRRSSTAGGGGAGGGASGGATPAPGTTGAGAPRPPPDDEDGEEAEATPGGKLGLLQMAKQGWVGEGGGKACGTAPWNHSC